MQHLVLALHAGFASSLRLSTHTAANQTETEGLAGGNLCMHGHLAPKFFLLGAPQSGPTHFFERLARSESIVGYMPAGSEPSWYLNESGVFSDGFNGSTKSKWLSHYPLCQQEKHKVVIDCTPSYFGSEAAPFALRAVYPPAHKLVFMVFLREPASRAHSHYYLYKDNGVLSGAFPGCTATQFPPTFAHAVELRLTQKFVCNCQCDDIFEQSMYADSFRRYFRNFDSEMFHVVPFKQAITAQVVEYAWEILNVRPGHRAMSGLDGDGHDTTHHHHPTLELEMHTFLLGRYRAFMDSMAGSYTVGRLLANSSAHLYQFVRRPRSAPQVAAWLEENWRPSRRFFGLLSGLAGKLVPQTLSGHGYPPA